jgi:hypothetical protein
MRNKLKRLTNEHKQKISDTRKEGFKSGQIVPWQKDKKMDKNFLIKNMRGHLKYDVSIEWLSSFNDIDKLKFLNRSITRKRDCEGFTTEIYKQFIERFYYDLKFNELYKKWIDSKDKWIKPSLDHIKSKSNGGNLLLDNLQFISWLENRAKVNIEQEQWIKIKDNINYYL